MNGRINVKAAANKTKYNRADSAFAALIALQ